MNIVITWPTLYVRNIVLKKTKYARTHTTNIGLRTPTHNHCVVGCRRRRILYEHTLGGGDEIRGSSQKGSGRRIEGKRAILIVHFSIHTRIPLLSTACASCRRRPSTSTLWPGVVRIRCPRNRRSRHPFHRRPRRHRSQRRRPPA